MLTQAQIDQYREAGYVLVEDVLETETLADLRRVTDEIVASAAGIEGHTNILDLEASHAPDAPRVRRIKQPHLADPFYRELAAHAGIMAALEPLIGENIRLRAGGKINMKSADYGSPVEWHQDWAFYPHTNQHVLAVGILLDDMDPDNGPLMVLPGSHRGPVYDHHSHGAFCGAIDVARENLDVSGAREVHGRAGSITIHHARLVHGSGMNKSDRQRRVLFFEYAAADAWPLAGIENLNDLEDFKRADGAWGTDAAPSAGGRPGEDAPTAGTLPRVDLREPADVVGAIFQSHDRTGVAATPRRQPRDGSATMAVA